MAPFELVPLVLIGNRRVDRNKAALLSSGDIPEVIVVDPHRLADQFQVLRRWWLFPVRFADQHAPARADSFRQPSDCVGIGGVARAESMRRTNADRQIKAAWVDDILAGVHDLKL